MAEQPSAAGSTIPADQVGRMFVQQYYQVLQHSPELVPRFYQEISKFSRAGVDGEMIVVTTLDAINEKIQSSNFVAPVIKTVDAQDSLNGGVTVMLTGSCDDENGGKRFFTQSFFLAPQANGYFVLNDMLRFTTEADDQLEEQGLTNGGVDPLEQERAADTLQQEQVGETVILHSEEGVEVNKEAMHDHLHGEVSAVDEEASDKVVVVDAVPKVSQAAVVEPAAVSSQQELPKKTYASILKLMSDNPRKPTPTSTPARPSLVKKERQAPHAPEPVQTSKVPSSTPVAAEGSNTQETEADGHSIYLRNLPMEATPAQIEEEFKRFGPIKPNGIQVRSNKVQMFCYGFVEFEVASAVQSAIEASPITIGGRPTYIEEKKTTNTRASGRGRYPTSRGGGGFRNDRPRGRSSYGGYGGGRGYTRND